MKRFLFLAAVSAATLTAANAQTDLEEQTLDQDATELEDQSTTIDESTDYPTDYSTNPADETLLEDDAALDDEAILDEAEDVERETGELMDEVEGETPDYDATEPDSDLMDESDVEGVDPN